MKVTVTKSDLIKQTCDCLITGVFTKKELSKSAKKLDFETGGQLSQILETGDISGKRKQSLLVYHLPNLKASRVLLVGCDSQNSLTDKGFREIIQIAIEALKETGIKTVCFTLADIRVQHRNLYWQIGEIVYSSLTALYAFTRFKTDKKKSTTLSEIQIHLPGKVDLKKVQQKINQARAIASGMRFTKDLANTPANICHPAFLAKQAQNLAKAHGKIFCEVFDTAKIKALEMNTLLSVAQGSDHPPKFITLKYFGKSKTDKPIILVGKGVTFDTGGNSLKPAMSMIGMKYDMSGAATVLGVLQACAELKLKLNVFGVIPAVENMPGSKASRPDDIVTSLSGKTIEILNTDAEGRLILCDALSYCEKFKPDTVIDIATLTGACIVALGHHASALYSNQDKLAKDLLACSEDSLDLAWHMPLWPEYTAQLNSPIADLANIAVNGGAGSITAACFLSEFTQKYAWAHLDVAGTAGYFSGHKRGASGRPVPLLVHYLLKRAGQKK